MKIRWWVVLVLALIPAMVFAKKDKKLPAIFANAQYVYVVSQDGDIFNPGLLQEDRQAILDVEASLRKWKRYTLTARPEEAQLIFIVRKGRLATGKLAGGIGRPQPGRAPAPGQPSATTLGVGGEAGPPDDLLEVRTVQDGKLATQIWFQVKHDGLVAPQLPLIKELEDAVDRDYPL